MRVAVVSDLHGNVTAFEAVLADVRQCSPDLVLHGGDLADNQLTRRTGRRVVAVPSRLVIRAHETSGTPLRDKSISAPV
jgi:Icc-related predicted phosphoesterase